jgi:hypothetical protein
MENIRVSLFSCLTELGSVRKSSKQSTKETSEQNILKSSLRGINSFRLLTILKYFLLNEIILLQIEIKLVFIPQAEFFQRQWRINT